MDEEKKDINLLIEPRAVSHKDTYLSDELYVDLVNKNGISIPAGSYNDFTVEYIGKSNINSSESQHRIYQGRVYKANNVPRIYLNDLLQINSYNGEYMKKRLKHTYGSSDRFETIPVGNYAYDVVVDLQDLGLNYQINDVLSFNKSISQKRKENINVSPTDEKEKIVNLLNLHTDVLPVVPRLGTAASDFYLGALVAPTNKFYESSKEGQDFYIRAVSKDQNDVIMPQRDIMKSEAHGAVVWCDINDDVLYLLSLPKDDAGGRRVPQEIGLVSLNNSKTYLPIAKIDKCNAEFYVIWCDRSGSYQCQPFSKKNKINEEVSSVYSADLTDKRMVIQKDVKYVWNLHSDWLDYAQHDAFESLLVSPVVQLYDTVNNELYDVIVKTSKWEKINKKNTKKPFNLQIDLEISRPQKIYF